MRVTRSNVDFPVVHVVALRGLKLNCDKMYILVLIAFCCFLLLLNKIDRKLNQTVGKVLILPGSSEEGLLIP